MKNGKMFSLRKRSGENSDFVFILTCPICHCWNTCLCVPNMSEHTFVQNFNKNIAIFLDNLFCRKESLSQIHFNLTSTTLQIQL